MKKAREMRKRKGAGGKGQCATWKRDGVRGREKRKKRKKRRE